MMKREHRFISSEKNNSRRVVSLYQDKEKNKD